MGSSTGLQLSTYFSAIKVRWMIDNYPEVAKAHEEDDMLFGTVESWVAYVSSFFLISSMYIKILTPRRSTEPPWRRKDEHPHHRSFQCLAHTPAQHHYAQMGGLPRRVL